MKNVLLLILLCLAAAAAQADNPVQPEFSMSARGDLEIGPDGRVRSWKMDGKALGERVEQLLQRNVEQWRFEPVLVDGKPVIAKTRMQVQLLASPQGDDYVVKVDNVTFGAPESRGALVLPLYPRRAVQASMEARVLVMFKLDATGDVVAVHAYQTSLSRHASSLQAPGWRSRFEQASLAAISRWKFLPDETIEGGSGSKTMIVPIHFQLGDPLGRAGARWGAYLPGPIVLAPWPDADGVAQVDADALGNGQAAALDSPFKLRSQVRGEVL